MLALVSIVTSALAIGAQQAPGDGKTDGRRRCCPHVTESYFEFVAGYAGRIHRNRRSQAGCGDGIVEFVADKTPIYQEYFVVSAAAREYAGARVEVNGTKYIAYSLPIQQRGEQDPEPPDRDWN